MLLNIVKGGFFKPWIYTQIDLGERELFSATMRCSDMIRRALDALMSVDYSTYLQHGQMIHEKFSRAVQSHGSHNFWRPMSQPMGSENSKKSSKKFQKSIFFDEKLIFINPSKIVSIMFWEL